MPWASSTLGVVDRRDQHKTTICRPHGQCRQFQAKPSQLFDSLVAVTNCLGAYISRCGGLPLNLQPTRLYLVASKKFGHIIIFYTHKSCTIATSIDYKLMTWFL